MNDLESRVAALERDVEQIKDDLRNREIDELAAGLLNRALQEMRGDEKPPVKENAAWHNT